MNGSVSSKGGCGPSSASVLLPKCPPLETDSWCYTEVADNTEFTYAWTIEKFNKIRENYPLGQTMYSEQFVIPLKKRNTIWRLKIYPNGRRVGDEGNLTVFLKDSNRQEPNNVKAHVEFSVVDSVGNRTNVKVVEKEYKVLHHAFGFSKFLRHTELLSANSAILPDGKLTIHCRVVITVLDTIYHSSYLPSKQDKHNSSLHLQHGLNMLNSPKEYFSDVTIVFRDGKVDCHSCILAARSPVFKAMFSHPLRENQTKSIQMEDEKKEMCTTLLQYLYTGSTEREKISIHLLILADKYQIQDLKDECERELSRQLTLENVLENFIIGDRHSAKRLKEAAKEYIVNHSQQFLKLPDWKRALKGEGELMAELLESVIHASPPPNKRRRVEMDELLPPPSARRMRLVPRMSLPGAVSVIRDIH